MRSTTPVIRGAGLKNHWLTLLRALDVERPAHGDLERDDEAAETLVRNGIYTVGAGSSGRLFLAWARLEQRQHKRKQAGLHARAAFHRMQAEGRPAVELSQRSLGGGITAYLVRRA